MSMLPDDVLLRILQKGTETRKLDNRAICRLAKVNAKFRQLSNHPSLWATLLSQDFPRSHYQYSEAPSKSLYRKKLEEERMASYEARRSSHCYSNYISSNPGHGRMIFPVHQSSTGRPSPSPELDDAPLQDCITKQRATIHLEQKFTRCYNRGWKPKAIPNARYYQPLHKPPRWAMPRKI